MIPGKPQMFKRNLLLIAVSLVVVGAYLGYSVLSGYNGFPLDDAWIHQVYARNLAQRGEWAFNPGQPSGGSTSPLWSILLAAGYMFPVNPVIWAAILGWVSLAGAAMLAENIVRRLNREYSPRFPWVGLFVVLEWHLVWAVVSGMETAFYILNLLLILWFSISSPRLTWLTGMLTGLAVWVRPDGLTMLGPVLFMIFFQPVSRREKWLQSLKIVLGFLVVFIPYLLFNLHQAGTIWPSTFAAKQAEYQSATTYPLIQRIGSLFLPFLAGGGVALIPGMIAGAFYTWRDRNSTAASIFLWFTGYVLMYTLRLPVFYQHGRYMMPAMAFYFLFALWGTTRWMRDWSPGKRTNLSRVFLIASIITVTILFLVIGANVYKTDVAIIESEMVQSARWLRENTPISSRLAVHDIGAVGYFAEREVIDLAGLVNPEVIPIIRDENRLRQYIDQQNVQYLVTFPGWYPELVKGLEPVYQTGGVISPAAGGENMVVYRWK